VEDKESRPHLVQYVATLPRFKAFRPQAIKKLTNKELISAIAGSTQLTQDMIRSALISLHLPARAAMLGAFMDSLGIPHEDGLIAEGATVKLPGADKLATAVIGLAKQFPPRDVGIYLLSLVAMDPETWSPLADVLPNLPAGLGT
ncbi:MAG TPA: hypothetical protein VG817_06710, partial [Gemmatimonadales bacterium]|nr:hypothetical protein [Gemmatimonadales bacterium]